MRRALRRQCRREVGSSIRTRIRTRQPRHPPVCAILSLALSLSRALFLYLSISLSLSLCLSPSLSLFLSLSLARSLSLSFSFAFSFFLSLLSLAFAFSQSLSLSLCEILHQADPSSRICMSSVSASLSLPLSFPPSLSLPHFFFAFSLQSGSPRESNQVVIYSRNRAVSRCSLRTDSQTRPPAGGAADTRYSPTAG